MRISPLPPLPSLIAFEAAMRHGSFTRAAAELHLTQSAISRQIAQLERFLGKKLFLREPRALRLTVSGQRYAALVQRLLVDCAEATEDIMKRKGHQELTVACSQGVAVLWLTPRLALSRPASGLSFAPGRQRQPGPALGNRLRHGHLLPARRTASRPGRAPAV